jgi:predicted MFS family arabinose efflux permease
MSFERRPGGLVATLLFIALVVAAIGSLGAPLITSVATTYRVSLAAAQWTLTVTLLTGAVAVPLLGRLGDGPRRRATVIVTLAIVVAGSVATVVPGPFWLLLAGRAAQGVGLDLTALRHPAVAGANLVMGIGGIGMYLLLTLITRYAQTPPDAGYGYGLSTFEAGLVLVPFSGLGFLADRVVPRLRGRLGPFSLLAASGAVVATAFVVFAAARRGLAGSVVAMAILGLGVGGFSAAMPQAILAVTPASQTASAMGLNQVVRAVGFSIGSATGGLVLAANTPPGHLLPSDGGYTIAALAGVAITALSIGVAVATGSRQRRLAGRPDRRRRPDG